MHIMKSIILKLLLDVVNNNNNFASNPIFHCAVIFWQKHL